MKNIHDSKETPDFSIVLGGPLFQLLMRLRLTTPALEMLKKRIICITLFAWLPLVIFSIIEGTALTGVKIPFFYDIEAQARFLGALPLMIAAELLVHRQLRMLIGQFVDREIITEKVLPQFKGIIDSAIKMRNSILAEIFILLFAFLSGQYIWNTLSIVEKIATGTGTWYGTTVGTETHLTMAGHWYIYVSRPLFQFIAYRWYYRIFIWALFLWRSARLKLNLIPTHPDRACGLGFLALSSIMFAPLIAAHGVLLSALIANGIFFAGEKLTDYMVLIIFVVLYILLIILGPLMVFTPRLMQSKRAGLRDYGILASKYVNEFDLKWIRGGAPQGEPLIASGDIQSLADLSNSFQVVRDIRPFVFDRNTAIQSAVFTLIPVVPLVLTMIPLEELIKQLFQAIF
jgi:hypothetical protein